MTCVYCVSCLSKVLHDIESGISLFKHVDTLSVLHPQRVTTDEEVY